MSQRTAAKATFALNDPPKLRRFLPIGWTSFQAGSSLETTPYPPVQFLGSTSYSEYSFRYSEYSEDSEARNQLPVFLVFMSLSSH